MTVNTIISTYQEIHSKRIVDKLSIVASPRFNVLRNSKIEKVMLNEIVLDDILILNSGNQIVTDSVVVDGEVLVNESFITGESDSVSKKVGDKILSGSFIVSGKCKARVEHIGEENYTYQISKDAKYLKKVKSEIMLTLNRLIKFLSCVIIPMGILLFFSQMNIGENDIKIALVNVTAALIGMIPEGLVLLTSTVLAVSVIRLSRSRVLVQQLYAVETLARVDTLCLDKTGTLTENKMEVVDLVTNNLKKEEFEKRLGVFSKLTEDENSTSLAIKEYFEGKEIKNENYKYKVPFSSDTKWSAVGLENGETLILGAPEFVTKDEKYLNEISKYTDDYRVLIFAKSNEEIKERKIPNNIEILGVILISDVIRKNASEVVYYFYEQGVDLKIISGDNPKTVSKIAKKVGIRGNEKYIDMSEVKDEEIEDVCLKYSVFGRVTPQQKKLLIKAMKNKGRTVAMTGDGVNDVLALKEADASIALANGSDASKSVSELVLLDSNFASMPKVVLEGRRTINNIERSAALFLVKTIYSCILALIFVLISVKYPFMPIQLSLISIVTIGIPSFLLALEPNNERVRGNFLKNIISRAAPSSLATICSIIICVIMFKNGYIDSKTYSTLCVISTATTGFCLLFKMSKSRKGESRLPFSVYRLVIAVVMFILFILELIFLDRLFSIVSLTNILKDAIKMILITSGEFIAFNLISDCLLKIGKNDKNKENIYK